MVDRYQALYSPYSYAMDDASVTAVRRYVAEGGTLWADGPLAWKDDHGRVRPQIPGGLTDVFGSKVEDILPAAALFALTPQDKHAGEEMRLTLTLWALRCWRRMRRAGQPRTVMASARARQFTLARH